MRHALPSPRRRRRTVTRSRTPAGARGPLLPFAGLWHRRRVQYARPVRVDILSKEFPPAIYGGAGVHVAELSRVLAPLVDLNVRCFGEPREPDFHGAHVQAYPVPTELDTANAAVQTLGVDLTMVQDIAGADLVHSHTWYANMGGHLSSLMYDIPHVLSAHSLEPLRPWKSEQLGGGYRISSFAEQTSYEAAAAIIAVSEGMRQDILRSYPAVDPQRVRTVHNGIDVSQWNRDEDTDVLDEYGIDPDRPSVVFVGRVTRQKGVPYLLRAALQLPSEVQLVLCAGAADTPELAAEVNQLIDQLRSERDGVVLIEKMLPRREVIQILSHATAFACPSVYEPLGIVNLEAMACGAAVVASRRPPIAAICGKSAAVKASPSHSTAARNSALPSWRTLPGQSYPARRWSASSVMPSGRSPGWRAIRASKWRARGAMSPVRSRKGGIVTGTTPSR